MAQSVDIAVEHVVVVASIDNHVSDVPWTGPSPWYLPAAGRISKALSLTGSTPRGPSIGYQLIV